MHKQFHWALAVVPVSVLLIGFIAVMFACKPIVVERFAELKAQVDADIVALRQAGSRS